MTRSMTKMDFVASRSEDPARASIRAEVAFSRWVSASRRLSVFHRNAATWELLLLLVLLGGTEKASVYDMVAMIESKALGPSALLKFIHEQAEAGNLYLAPNPKQRNKRIIYLNAAIESELIELLERRNGSLVEIEAYTFEYQPKARAAPRR